MTSKVPARRERRTDLTINDVIEDYCVRRLETHSKNPTASANVSAGRGTSTSRIGRTAR